MIMSSENIFRILVTDSQHLAALGAIRSFGRAGHVVTVAYFVQGNPPPAISSRYCATSQFHPDPWSQQQAFRKWLVDITANEAFDVLLPTTEATIVACNAVKTDLPHSLAVLAPSTAHQSYTLSKYRATLLAQENGLITPKTIFLGQPNLWPGWWPESSQQSDFDLDELNYPVILKSDNHFATNGAYCQGKSIFCESPGILKHKLETSRGTPARLIAQEFISGHGEAAFLLRFNGETRLRFAHKRIHEIPRRGGRSCLRESSDNTELLEYADRLLSACDFEGLAMVEFRRGDDAHAYFLEINARPWGSIALALHSGIDFPLAWLELSLSGKTAVVQKNYPVGLRCCTVFPGEIDYLRSVNSEPDSQKAGKFPRIRDWAVLLNSIFNPFLRHDQFWWSDPAPGFRALRNTASRETGRLLRPALENLKWFAFRKKGALRFAATLLYNGWSRAMAMKHWLDSKRHLRRMSLVNKRLKGSAKIMFLCYGNICRSPFASEYWNNRLRGAGIDGPSAFSSGYHPESGRTTPEIHRKIARRSGIQLDNHRSAIVSQKNIDEADIVFVMDADNMNYLRHHFPQALNKAFYLGLMSADRSIVIPDPYQLPEAKMLAAYGLIKSSLNTALNTVLANRREPGHPLRIFTFHAIVSQPLEIQHVCFLEQDLFKQQLELINQYFKVLPLSEAVRKLQAGELTKPTAVITFDDGFHNNYTLAFPELKRTRTPATIFVSTGFTDSNKILWFCRVLRAVTDTTLSEVLWNDNHFDLSGELEKLKSANAMMAQLKILPHNLLESETDVIEQLLGFEAGKPVDPDSPYRLLSSQAIQEMSDSGLVEFGGHTHSHSILSRLSASEQCQEIRSSIESLSQLLGVPCSAFAYPNGRFDDYDENSIECLRQAGVSIAVTAVSGGNQWFDSPLDLGRESLGPLDSKQRLEHRIRLMIERDSLTALLQSRLGGASPN